MTTCLGCISAAIEEQRFFRSQTWQEWLPARCPEEVSS